MNNDDPLVPTTGTYEIDSKWRIVWADEFFCRIFQSTAQGLMGRDIRDLVKSDWRQDFKAYVARALTGVGPYEVTMQMISPSGELGWFKHSLEPLLRDNRLIGYRAVIVRRFLDEPAPVKKRSFWKSLLRSFKSSALLFAFAVTKVAWARVDINVAALHAHL